MKPAIVRYIKESDGHFTKGKEYEAFFLEYWQGTRNNLLVRDDRGEVTDFNPFEHFEVVSDEDGLLTLDEAVVRCVTHEYEGQIMGLTCGREYKAIGRTEGGRYLVMDDSWDCCFYPPEAFEIVRDPHGILSRRSIYFVYNIM